MKFFTSMATMLIFTLSSCNNSSDNTADMDSVAAKTDSTSVSVKEENVTIASDTTSMHSYIAYDENKKGKRPVVLIIPEWWGLNDYPKSRARQLAGLGYFAVAVDLYGNGRIAENPDQAQALSGIFYANPKLAMNRMEAALAKAKTYAEADTTRVAAIGYCFGGSMVLNMARMEMPLDGVVSFHGVLSGLAPAKKTMSTKTLVCQGMDDQFSPEKDLVKFKKEQDAAGASYIIKEYPGATHAFTNPAATENGKKFNIPIAYNPEADKNSWNDMQDFFAMLWK